MPEIRVETFLFDDENEEKLWAHQVSPKQALQVLDNEFIVTKNRRDRAATHLIIGIDLQGQCLAIPIMPTYVDGQWRPVTARYCKPGERARFTKRRG